jgi:LPS-assembly lipoprotein
MRWRSRNNWVGRTAGAIALLGLAPCSGCGFTPLYATPGIGQGLSSIDVVAPQGRVGYLLREDLEDALGRDKSASPRWRLEMTVDQSRSPRGLTEEDVAERYVLAINVRYHLTEVATGKIAHTGSVASEVSYDAADAPYAAIAARQDTQQRAANDAARKIQIDLAAWLAEQHNR